MASTKKFYVIHQSILHPGTNNSTTNSITSDSERNFQRLKSSKENLALIEQCFTNKVGPITIAAVIAGRKKSDGLAKNFFKQLPNFVSDKVSNLLDEPTCSCRICQLQELFIPANKDVNLIIFLNFLILLLGNNLSSISNIFFPKE